MASSRRSAPRATLTVRLDRALADRLRAFVRDHAGKPLYLSMGSFVADAIVDHLDVIERKLERGERDPTPRQNSNLR